MQRFLSWILRPLSVRFMTYWIEDRAQRRQDSDNKVLYEFRQQLSKEWSIRTDWERLPQRLRGRALKDIRKHLEEEIHNSQYSSHLGHIIRNARECGITISFDEECTLYERALKKAYGAERMVFFAQQLYVELLKEDRIPFTTLVSILERLAESPLNGFFPTDEGEKIAPVLKEVCQEDQEEVDVFLRHIADLGRYRQLKAACNAFEQPIPEPLLRICFNEKLSQGKYTYIEVIEMCVALEDWDQAEMLIAYWLTLKNGRDFAGRLALALYEHKKSIFNAS